MRVLVLGGTGMLGHKLWQHLSGRHDVWATVRGSADALGPARELVVAPRVIEHVTADAASVARAIATARPEVVVNAIGIVKQSGAATDVRLMEAVNSRFPHEVAAQCVSAGARLIHLSTDCVFSGARGNYAESDAPDPKDPYDRSKLAGEVAGPGCLTLRTSMIGRELAGQHGLVEWFLAQAGGDGPVRGYTRAVFSGLPTLVLARVIGDLIAQHPTLEGLYHVAAAPIAKHDLLQLLKAAYHLPVTIEPFDGVVIDRSLNGARFRSATRFAAPAWPELVNILVSDPTPYDRWRRSRGA